MCDIYNCDCLAQTTFRFNLIDFQLNKDIPSQFCVFTVKSPSVIQRSVSQENAFRKEHKVKTRVPVAFFSQNYKLK